MRLHTICFSPTGGTKKVIDQVGKCWEEIVEIDLSNNEIDFGGIDLSKEDTVIIAVPSFGGRVPQIALSHIKKLKGNQTKAVLVVVYGNRAYDDTLIELYEAVEKQGFEIIAAVAAVAEHSIMREYAKGRPDDNDKIQLQSYGKIIKEALEQSKGFYKLTLPGNKPYREYKGVPFKPKAGNSCTKCKVCAKACPVAAIPEDKPNKTNESICISCMRCIKICPTNSRKLNKLMLTLASKKMGKLFEERKNNEIFVAIKED